MLLQFWDQNVNVDPGRLPGELGFEIGVYAGCAEVDYRVTCCRTTWREASGEKVVLPPRKLDPVEFDDEAHLYRLNPLAPPSDDVTGYQVQYEVVVPLNGHTRTRCIWDVVISWIPPSDGVPAYWRAKVIRREFGFYVRMSDYVPSGRQVRPPPRGLPSYYPRVGDE